MNTLSLCFSGSAAADYSSAHGEHMTFCNIDDCWRYIEQMNGGRLVVVFCAQREMYHQSIRDLITVSHRFMQKRNNWLVFLETAKSGITRALVVQESTAYEWGTLQLICCDCNGHLVMRESISLFDRRFYTIPITHPLDTDTDGHNMSLKYVLGQVIAYEQGSIKISPDRRLFELALNSEGLNVASSQLLYDGDSHSQSMMPESVRLSSLYLVNSAASSLGAVEVAPTSAWMDLNRAFDEWRIKHVQNSSIQLRPHKQRIATAVTDAINCRSSASGFQNTPLKLSSLSTILCNGAGGREDISVKHITFPRRKYPTAGSLATVRMLVIVQHIVDLESRTYFFDQDASSLYPLTIELTPTYVATHSAYCEKISSAAAIILFIVDLSLLGRKYRERAARFALIEIGHLAQNLIVAASGLGLATCPIAGFDEMRVASRLRLKPPFFHLPYILTCGVPRQHK